MKYFIDGNQLVITRDDFVDLQESPALFYPISDEIAQVVLKRGVRGLPMGDLMQIREELNALVERACASAQAQRLNQWDDNRA